MSKLTNKQRDFIEEFARLDPGMPRAMGLILGYLLVCEPAEQPSHAMQQELDLSAGSVSNMIGMLVNAGLVSRVKKPHDRKFYYVVAKGSWLRTIEMRLEGIKRVRDIARQGMRTSNNYRMGEIWEVYDSFATDLEQMVDRLNKRKQRNRLH